jgi:signal transduction histidine kinase
MISQHKLELQNISLSVTVAPDIPCIMADNNQVQQCIINLIFNAIDAMPDGGSIDLSAQYDAEKNKVTIVVKDTGTGIGTQDLPHIFEPFFTTKEEGYGVGLGLSTVYGIMERHKGAVRVDNSMSRGTRFILEFNVLANE